jgi:hypothetical protein
MTIGPGLIALAWAERPSGAPRGPVSRAIITFGRVPLFFYVLQWIWAKLAGFVLGLLAGHDTSMFFQYPFDFALPDDHGFGLVVTYAAWGLGIAVLYWPCRWFARVKAERRDWWLSYL